jgi:hypothetical protein
VLAKDFLGTSNSIRAKASGKADPVAKSSKLKRDYKVVRLRVRLPNRLVLEGLFSSVETIGDLYFFVGACLDKRLFANHGLSNSSSKKNLWNPSFKLLSSVFTLFVTPPRTTLLDPKKTFVRCLCAVAYSAL